MKCTAGAAPGIQGRMLGISQKTLSIIGGQCVRVKCASGCGNEACSLYSDDPADACYRWTPNPEDQLVLLGRDYADRSVYDYYALRRASGDNVYMLVAWREDWWPCLDIIDIQDVPGWVFLKLVFTQGRR